MCLDRDHGVVCIGDREERGKEIEGWLGHMVDECVEAAAHLLIARRLGLAVTASCNVTLQQEIRMRFVDIGRQHLPRLRTTQLTYRFPPTASPSASSCLDGRAPW